MSKILIKYTLILAALAVSAYGVWSINTFNDSSALTIISKESANSEASGCALALIEASDIRMAESNSTEPAYSQGRRSFSFHYLDILELLFSAKNEAVKAPRTQPPSTSNAT